MNTKTLIRKLQAQDRQIAKLRAELKSAKRLIEIADETINGAKSRVQHQANMLMKAREILGGMIIKGAQMNTLVWKIDPESKRVIGDAVINGLSEAIHWMGRVHPESGNPLAANPNPR